MMNQSPHSSEFKIIELFRMFDCQACGLSTEGWDDGNPYILNANGGCEYFYHPGISLYSH